MCVRACVCRCMCARLRMSGCGTKVVLLLHTYPLSGTFLSHTHQHIGICTHLMALSCIVLLILSRTASPEVVSINRTHSLVHAFFGPRNWATSSVDSAYKLIRVKVYPEANQCITVTSSKLGCLTYIVACTTFKDL